MPAPQPWLPMMHHLNTLIYLHIMRNGTPVGFSVSTIRFPPCNKFVNELKCTRLCKKSINKCGQICLTCWDFFSSNESLFFSFSKYIISPAVLSFAPIIKRESFKIIYTCAGFMKTFMKYLIRLTQNHFHTTDFKFNDQFSAIQIFFWFPCVVTSTVVFPFQKVLNLKRKTSICVCNKKMENDSFFSDLYTQFQKYKHIFFYIPVRYQFFCPKLFALHIRWFRVS